MRISDWSSDVCSSDLPERRTGDFLAVHPADGNVCIFAQPVGAADRPAPGVGPTKPEITVGERIEQGVRLDVRSEEHTSELQSLMRISYALFCLKKKTTTLI